MESYVRTSRKGIKALPKFNEVATRKFIDSPTRNMTLIKNIFPKMEKYEKRISKSVASYRSSFKQHTFSHGYNHTFEAREAFIIK